MFCLHFLNDQVFYRVSNSFLVQNNKSSILNYCFGKKTIDCHVQKYHVITISFVLNYRSGLLYSLPIMLLFLLVLLSQNTVITLSVYKS